MYESRKDIRTRELISDWNKQQRMKFLKQKKAVLFNDGDLVGLDKIETEIFNIIAEEIRENPTMVYC